MRILFVGDIVGQAGLDLLLEHLPDLTRRHRSDAVVVNAENMNLSGPRPHDGFGMLAEQVEALLAAGADVITSGNHAWDGSGYREALAHPRVLRPVNVPPGWCGRGSISIPVANQTLSVINVADESSIPEASAAYPAFAELSLPPGLVLVDYHGDLVSRKFAFAFAVDGTATAVLGTHTHEPTLLAHRLPKGTGFVAEVGMTGPLGGVLGTEPELFARQAMGLDVRDLPPVGLAPGPVTLGAVLVAVDQENAVREIRRVGLEGDHAMDIA